MATDYDAPRRTETDDVSEDSLEELKARRNEAQSAVVDVVHEADEFFRKVMARRNLRDELVGATVVRGREGQLSELP